MKNRINIVTLIISLAATAGFSQEIVPQADAMKGAAMAWQASADITDAPVVVDPDIKNPFAMKGGSNIGMLVVPETKLAKEIEHAGAGVTPVAQIWLRGLLPVFNGSTATLDKLRTVSVSDGANSLLVPVLFVGLQNGTVGKELVIFSQDKTALATLPLKAVEQEQKLPVEFSVVANNERKSAEVTMTLVGKFQANFGLAAEN
ncbi:MAG: hypothetical protein K1X78_27400 [Verrucomicrobiaceae bacterium]|nr:hypothetical protein [Verrucomicrobiaceae bacterium]